MTDHERILRDSGLFTQVEPEWLAESDKAVTYVNHSRGVVIKVNRAHFDGKGDARFFYDRGDDTYASSGWYTPEEITNWIIPVMLSDRAWRYFINTRDADLTEALDRL